MHASGNLAGRPGRWSAIGALAVVLLGGCFLSPDEDLRDQQTLPAGITGVTVAGAAGAVRIETSADATTVVHPDVRYRGKPPGATTTVRGGTLTVSTSCGPECSVDGRTGSGNLRLRGGAGSVVVEPARAIPTRPICAETPSTRAPDRATACWRSPPPGTPR